MSHSSIVDQNINLNDISNLKTITVSMFLNQGNTRTVDLTNCGFEGVFGHLDFEPDYVILKYITYTGNCEPDNVLPILTCNFTNHGILAPFLPRTSNNAYNLRYKCNFKLDIRHATFTHQGLTDDLTDDFFPDGTIAIGLEFVRYRRFIEY